MDGELSTSLPENVRVSGDIDKQRTRGSRAGLQLPLMSIIGPVPRNSALPAQAGQSQAYEVLLFGEFVNDAGRLEAIMNRLSLVCEGGASHIQFSEWHFEPLQRTEGDNGGTLLLRRAHGAPGWCASRSKSVTHCDSWRQDSAFASQTRASTGSCRSHSACCDFVHNGGSSSGIRKCVGIQVRQILIRTSYDSLILHRSQRFQLHKRGYIFRRGCLTITLLQMDQVEIYSS